MSHARLVHSTSTISSLQAENRALKASLRNFQNALGYKIDSSPSINQNNSLLKITIPTTRKDSHPPSKPQASPKPHNPPKTALEKNASIVTPFILE